MKKLLFIIGVALLAVACDTGKPGEAQGDLPLPASIDGVAQNRCPSESVTLSAFVQNAAQVEWRKDGEIIEGQTSRTLTVTESGSYTATGVNGHGNGVSSKPQVVTIHGCLTTLAGNDTNRCPDETVILVASAFGASKFEWYKDGEVIEGQDSPSYSVTESGSYAAAAVYGTRLATPSEARQVTIVECPFIDAITGQWDAGERMIWYGDVYNNNHIVTIEKVDDTTIEIYNFTGENISQQTVTATVDNEARTITIPYQEIITADTDNTYSMYLASLEHNFPGANIGVGIGTVTAEGKGKGMTFTFPSPRQVGDRGGNSYNGTWQTLAIETASDTYMGQAVVGVETVWTKK